MPVDEAAADEAVETGIPVTSAPVSVGVTITTVLVFVREVGADEGIPLDADEAPGAAVVFATPGPAPTAMF